MTLFRGRAEFDAAEKDDENNDSVVTFLWDVLNRLPAKQLVVTFLWDVPTELKEEEKDHERIRMNRCYSRDVFMGRAMQVRSDLKDLIDQYGFTFFPGRVAYIYF